MAIFNFYFRLLFLKTNRGTNQVEHFEFLSFPDTDYEVEVDLVQRKKMWATSLNRINLHVDSHVGTL